MCSGTESATRGFSQPPCVINVAADKRVVLAEAARVLRHGGRFAVSDVIAEEGMDDATRADMAQWTGCIAGALTEAEFRAALADAGLVDVEIPPHTASTSTPARPSSAPASPDNRALAAVIDPTAVLLESGHPLDAERRDSF